MKQHKITIPIEVWDNFDDDIPLDEVKEYLGEMFDHAIEHTDLLWDLWKHAEVVEVA